MYWGDSWCYGEIAVYMGRLAVYSGDSGVMGR